MIKTQRYPPFLTIILFMFFDCSCLKNYKSPEESATETPAMPIIIPTEGNSWFFNQTNTPQMQYHDFTSYPWASANATLRTYFRINGSGELHIGIHGKVESGESELKASILDVNTSIKLSHSEFRTEYITTVEIPHPGYFTLNLEGIRKSADSYAVIESIRLGGEATESGVHFVDEEFFYWGRRGPSVHLSYVVPDEASHVVWFYNEITVPPGNDVIGSFFMTNGFAEGYFGFQVNSATERRILFSVWSPFETDNPNEIPPDQRVLLLARGENVTTNDFGGEGSGGQSYWIYPWSAGTTYRFLLKGEPAGNDNTDYTAYFYSPEWEDWKLIAVWRRPKTNTYIKRPHSFLENFVTHTGTMQRLGYYSNQWIYDSEGRWFELTRARLTADATARANARLDFAGGYDVSVQTFYLKNCGFFNETASLDTYHTRPAMGQAPDIAWDALPKK